MFAWRTLNRAATWSAPSPGVPAAAPAATRPEDRSPTPSTMGYDHGPGDPPGDPNANAGLPTPSVLTHPHGFSTTANAYRECVSASAANEFAELDPVGRASRQSFFGALPGSLHGPLRTAEKQRGVAQRLTHARESDDFCSTVARKHAKTCACEASVLLKLAATWRSRSCKFWSHLAARNKTS